MISFSALDTMFFPSDHSLLGFSEIPEPRLAIKLSIERQEVSDYRLHVY